MTKRPKKSKDLISVTSELMEMPSSKTVQFREQLTQEEEEELRVKQSEQPLTDAYVVTNSEYEVSNNT